MTALGVTITGLHLACYSCGASANPIAAEGACLTAQGAAWMAAHYTPRLLAVDVTHDGECCTYTHTEERP